MDEDESNGYVDISNDNSDVMWMKMGNGRDALRLPSVPNGPLRLITSHSRFALFSTM